MSSHSPKTSLLTDHCAPHMHGKRPEPEDTVAKLSPTEMLGGNPSRLEDGMLYNKWKGADTGKNISEINIIQPETQAPLTLCQYDQLFSSALTSWLYFFSLSLGENSFAYRNH